MYLNFYNLKKEPFHITPDPQLLYLSPSHREALGAIIYGVEKRKGFITIVGEVGVGKTTIIRSALERIGREKCKAIYIFNANIPFKALLETIFQNLGSTAKTGDVYGLVDQLHRLLIEEYKSGKNVVLMIDEAQNMPIETLENLRMLSNLETATDKLIQIVFSGQPEFEAKLKQHVLRQLRQRIAIRTKILPLTRNESLEYIKHRLTKTQLINAELFSKQALRQIVNKAEGIPRLINILCDNCLITSFGNRQTRVTKRVAKEIIGDLGMAPTIGDIRWRLAIAGTVLLLLATAFWWNNEGNHFAADIHTQPQTIAPVSGQRAETNDSSQAVAEPPAGTAGKIAEDASVGADQQKHPDQLRKVVRRGDTLAKLLLETYGSTDKALMKLVKERNPRIVDENTIREGDTLYFPLERK